MKLRKITFAILTSVLLAVSQFATAQNAMYINIDGQVGVGTDIPSATMEVLADQTTVGIGNAVLKLSKEGGLAFQLDDTAVEGFWNFSAAVAETQFRISKSGTGQTEMKLDDLGNLTITGELITGGPTCTLGCDRVFNQEYQMLSIEEHAKQMFEDKHLPAIGPVVPKEPINISDQFGNFLNELETAHIYIAQLKHEKDTLQTKVDSLESRLSELEGLLKK